MSTATSATVVAPPLLELRAVSKHFVDRPDVAARLAGLVGAAPPVRVVRALDRIDLEIGDGEMVGLVGESGCGKSTLGRVAAGLHQPTAGTRHWRGRDVRELGGRARRDLQLGVQMIFQDPFASLNPRMRIGEAIGEAPAAHGIVPPGERDAYVERLLRRVGLDPRLKHRYPHQFSGGQRQRVSIARALAVEPDVLVCDEAVTALDVSIQAQVLNLFMALREALGLAYLFITHDLGVVEHMSDRVYVMYLGRVVESAPTEELFAAPDHPYTQALLGSRRRLETRTRRFEAVTGEIPSPYAPPSGCHFHPRCPLVTSRCRSEAPILRGIAPGRRAACHLNDAS